jgi:hypothetical protein
LQIRVQEDAAQARAEEKVVDVVVETDQLLDLLLILRVQRVKLLVHRLQLLVGALQLLVGGDQLLVRGL